MLSPDKARTMMFDSSIQTTPIILQYPVTIIQQGQVQLVYTV